MRSSQKPSFISINVLLSISFPLATIGCDGTIEASSAQIIDPISQPSPCDQPPASLVPPRPPGVPDQRGDAFFTTSFPLRETSCLRDGRALALPYQAYVVDSMTIGGTADLRALRAAVAGSGYQPVTTDGGRGFAHLWVLHYLDTSVGPYNEFAVTIDVARTPTSVPFVNACTPIVTGLTSGVFNVQLLIDQSLALEAGRENSGLDKRPGTIVTSPVTEGRAIDVRTRGRSVVSGSVPYRAAGALDGALCLAGALGIPPEVLGQLPREGVSDMVNRDVEAPGETRVSKFHFQSSLNAFVNIVSSPDLRFTEGTELGQLLRRLDFTPTAVSIDPALEMALDLPVQ